MTISARAGYPTVENKIDTLLPSMNVILLLVATNIHGDKLKRVN